jgi:hypothetical protein
LGLAASLAIGIQLAAASVALGAGLPTDPDPDLACPAEFGTGFVSHYVTTVHTPADAKPWSVTVEFTIVDGDGPASCQLTLASYELPGPDFSFPQTLHDSDTGTFGAGTHTLSVGLPLGGSMPGCFSQYDFVFGPAIETLVFEDRYGDRQIRSRIEGSENCPADPPKPPEPPEGGEEGETGGPPLPDSAMAPSAPDGMAAVYALGLVVLLGTVGFVNLRAVAATRRR